MKKKDEAFEISDVLGGTLNMLGIKIDLAKLLSSPEDMREQLETLRARLKRAGAKEVLADDEWRSGGATIGGHLRTRGILGNKEYHIGTSAPPRPGKPKRQGQTPEVVEPAADVFDEPEETIIVVEVPGVGLEDLQLKIEADVLYLSTRPTAQRGYRKEINLVAEVDKDSLRAACRNGILEVRLRKKPPQ